MRPLYFGSSERKLYGVYEAPAPDGTGAASARGRNGGVVLCYPGVQDYNIAHAAFRKLGALLARSGLHVFRFDYFGTGDSAGDVADGEPAAWVSDVRAAADELKELAGVRAVSLVGFRLGATLAAQAVAGGLTVEDLVLWDPVVIGRDYVEELEARDRRQNLMLLHATSRFAPKKDELLGYPFSGTLRAALERIDLRRTAGTSRVAASRVSLVVSEERAAYAELGAALARHCGVSHRHVPDDATATIEGAREEVLLANKILVAIRDALLGEGAGDA